MSWTKIMECVPNFSEGRDLQKIDQIVSPFRARAGVKLLDYSNDEDHNRLVVTVVGEPDALKEAVIEAIGIAVKLIDLNHHQGQHPRMGAVDVVPFIPIKGCTMEEAITISKEVAQRVASQYDLPVFLYEKSASAPHRENLAKTFLNTMESYGYKNVAVYSNKYLFETKLTASVFSDYPKWIAQHSNKCTYQGSYHMWQYSTQGVIPGISEKVDLNYKIGNWTYAGYSSAKKTVVVKPKATTIKSLRKSGKKAVKITYKKVSGVSGYQIYMSTKKKSGYKKIATLSSKKSSYTKGKLKKGKKYYFKVRTMKKVSGKYRYSSFSKVRSIKR